MKRFALAVSVLLASGCGSLAARNPGDSAVYAAVVLNDQHTFVSEPPRPVLVLDHTEPWLPSSLEPESLGSSTISPELFARLRAANGRSTPIKPFPLPPEYSFYSYSEFEAARATEARLAALSTRFGQAPMVLYFTRPAYSPDGERAAVAMSSFNARNGCGLFAIYSLVHAESSWQVTGTTSLIVW